MSTNRTHLRVDVQRWLAFLTAYKNNPEISQGQCRQRERRFPLSPVTVCDGARPQRPLSLISIRRGTRFSHPLLRPLPCRTLRHVCWLGWAGVFEPEHRLRRATALPPCPHDLGNVHLHVAPRGSSCLLPAHTCASEFSRCFRVCSARCTLVNFNWWCRPLGQDVVSSEPAPLIQNDHAPNCLIRYQPLPHRLPLSGQSRVGKYSSCSSCSDRPTLATRKVVLQPRNSR